MTPRRQAVLASLGATGIACARPPAPRPAAVVPADSAVTISLERGPCFGACPVYSVRVTGAGVVEFEGRRFVKDSGHVTAAIPPARVDSLLAMIEASGFYALADRYRYGDPACGRYATDLPTVTLEVSASGRHKRVEHEHGCGDAPTGLNELEGRIDSVLGTGTWTGTPR